MGRQTPESAAIGVAAKIDISGAFLRPFTDHALEWNDETFADRVAARTMALTRHVASMSHAALSVVHERSEMDVEAMSSTQ